MKRSKEKKYIRCKHIMQDVQYILSVERKAESYVYWFNVIQSEFQTFDSDFQRTFMELLPMT